MAVYMNIKTEMVRQRKTVRGLAKEFGVSENTLRRKINGRVEWGLREFIAFCKLLGKSMLYLSEVEEKGEQRQ